MEEPKHQFCGICEQRHVNKLAVVWCPQCEDALCTDCTEQHGLWKLSKHHTTIGIEDYNQLPPFILSTKHNCEYHSAQYEIYCKNHQAPCCIFCMKDTHNGCDDLEPILNMTKGIKHSAKFENLEKLVDNLKIDLDYLIQYVSDSLSQTEDQLEGCIEELKRARQSINDHFDSLEMKLTAELAAEKKTFSTRMEKTNLELKDWKKNVVSAKQNLDKLKQISTDLQTFFGLIEIEKELTAGEAYMQSLCDDNTLSQIDLSLNVSTSIKSVIENCNSFGQVFVQNIPFQKNLKTLMKDQSQLIIKKPNYIHDMKLKQKHKAQLNVYINGCAIIPSGDLLIVDDRKKQLLSCKNDGSHLREIITFPWIPTDITFIPQNNVAVVSSSSTGQIVYIDLDLEMETETIQMPCYGIDLVSDKLLVGSGRNFYTCMSIKDEVQSKTDISSRSIYYVTANDTRIYCSSYTENTIICFDWEGNQQWEFKHNDLRGPLAITSTSDSYVFVTGRESRNIFLISPDGTENKIILTEKDGLSNTRAIHFSRERNELLITNEISGEIFLYDVIYR